ncbi:MAG: hypothetical protein LC135_09915 [Phycisphaerae bacterium]|nr:hypothetical protein [Phycisphaerae bacterium]MCZ2400163.1 hypothetical protein [Phycisphaerae bacterium]
MLGDNGISRILTSDEFHRRLYPKLPRSVAVEEVLGRTWERARDKMPTVGDHVAWLLRVGANIARDDLKAERRRRRREREVGCTDCRDETCTNDPPNMHATQAQNEPVHDVGPGAALERRELRRAIVNAVRTARLPRNHRCALWAWLRDEIAKWAAGRGIPAATARVWALRARDALRPHLVAVGLASAGT